MPKYTGPAKPFRISRKLGPDFWVALALVCAVIALFFDVFVWRP